MKNRKGFLLVGVLFAFLFLMIIVPVMVKWVQNDTKISVKDQKSSFAFSLAEAAVDRGYWKVKGSTSTFDIAMTGGVLYGYNNDVKYTDISGGNYRVRISSGPGTDQVTIIGEGRDWQNKETRAIQAVFTNTSVPGAIIAGGAMNASGSSVVHWGPIMSMGDITVTQGALTNGYPRKLSRQTVKPFDSTNDTNPPNTDSLEWWSNYNVPELPVFDFTTMRSSAAATGTLNCQQVSYTSYTYTANPEFTGTACTDSDGFGGNCTCTTNYWLGKNCTDSDGGSSDCVCTNIGHNSGVCSGSACTGPAGSKCVNYPRVCTGSACTGPVGGNCVDLTTISTTSVSVNEMECCHSAVLGGPVTCDYGGTGCTDCSVLDLYNQTALRDKDYTWYWDNNASWTGGNGLRGTIVVRGNLGIDGGDYYCSGCTVKVPPQAWEEYQKYDTSTTNQYPGDTGLQSNAATYTFGSNASSTCSGIPSLVAKGELWRTPCGSSGLGADLGVYGFLYVGGNFTRTGDSDIYGAMWVVGDVTGSGNTMLFYNSNLKLPTLNVVLTKESWQEQKPSATVWP